jgi:hypothetical protein
MRLFFLVLSILICQCLPFDVLEAETFIKDVTALPEHDRINERSVLAQTILQLINVPSFKRTRIQVLDNNERFKQS